MKKKNRSLLQTLTLQWTKKIERKTIARAAYDCGKKVLYRNKHFASLASEMFISVQNLLPQNKIRRPRNQLGVALVVKEMFVYLKSASYKNKGFGVYHLAAIPMTQ